MAFEESDEIRCPSSRELITIWERGLGRPSGERALLLLEVCVGARADELAGWSVGRRDAALFRLRRVLFGEPLSSVARCRQCLAQVDLSFTLSDIWAAGETSGPGRGVVSAEGYQVEFRAPDSTDLAAVRQEESVEAARSKLLERCIVSVSPQADPPDAVVQAVVLAIAASDPAADRRLDVVCAECGSHWEEIFDIAIWLLSEISAWVRKSLQEVHVLAAAYGWREEDILAMNPTRRQLYMSMLAQE